MEQGQTCTHGNLNWCNKGCFEPDHEDEYLVTLEITVKAKSRDDAFSQVDKLLPHPLRVCLYDAEAVEHSVQRTCPHVETFINPISGYVECMACGDPLHEASR